MTSTWDQPAILDGPPRPEPSRITCALDLRGLYGPDVDTACGTTEPHVDRWEADTEAPTPGQVEKLAALTGFPVAFFYGPPVDPVGHLFVCSEKDICPPPNLPPVRTRMTPRPKPVEHYDDPDLHPMAAVRAFRKWQEQGGGKAVPPPPGWRPTRSERKP
jgi:hypothetical protein